MNKLIKLEIRKISKQKSFYVCFGIALAILILGAIIAKNLAAESNQIISGVNSAKSALQSSSFVMILGIFVALYVCDDYSNNTLKNIYSKGYSRRQVFLSKYITSAIIVEIIAIAYMIIAFMMGETFGNATSIINGEFITTLLAQLAIILAYHTLYFSVAMIIGKVGGSVSFNLVGPMLIITILGLVTSLLNLDSVNISSYWLDSTFSSLGAETIKNSVITDALIKSILFTGIFGTAGFILNDKKEI